MIASAVPEPAMSGASIRISQFARHIARRHRVTLVCYTDVAADRQAIDGLGSAGIEVVPVQPPSGAPKRVAQLASLGSRASHLNGIFHSGAMQSAIDSLLAARPVDVVLVEGSLLMRHRFPQTTPLVLDEHNLEFEALERTAAVQASPVSRFVSRAESAKVRREEVAAWRRAGLVVFTSARESQIAHSLCPGLQSLAVGNGVDLDYFAPAAASTR